MGEALETASVPIIPDAPALLSTTTGTFNFDAKRKPINLAKTSAVVPVVYGTIKLIDFEGKLGLTLA